MGGTCNQLSCSQSDLKAIFLSSLNTMVLKSSNTAENLPSLRMVANLIYIRKATQNMFCTALNLALMTQNIYLKI